MAISINWATRVIYVPKSFSTLVQSVPTEIRNLDINAFRLALKDLEDDVDGICFPDTHLHYPPVSVGSVVLAMVIQIINDYTVTFEDGQYAVNLVGANSNIGDRVNVNQVSVRSANSAGLVTSDAIEYGEYGGEVTVDVINGVPGTLYPIGTLRRPVNNFIDAAFIANVKGFSSIKILSDSTIGTGVNLGNKTIRGLSHIFTKVTIESDANVINAIFIDCILNGVLDGNNDIKESVVQNITYMNGHIHDSFLCGTIVLDGAADAYIANCSRLDISAIPIIDMGGSGQNLAMPNYAGAIKIINMNGSNKIGIGLASGSVTLDSTTVTSGIVTVSGVGFLQDENGTYIPTGVWNGGVTVNNYLISKETIADAIWGENINIYSDVTTFGGYIQTLLKAASAGELDSIPGVDGDLSKQIQFLFQYFRLKRIATNVKETMFKDDGITELGSSVLIEDNTTFTKQEMI